MGISQFIKSICVQPAVYWGNPQPDGFGGITYDDPIQVYVRWDDKVQSVIAQNGELFVSKSVILTPDDFELQGKIKLGLLSEIGTDETDAWEIKVIEKTPMIKSKTEFVRTMYLAPSNFR